MCSLICYLFVGNMFWVSVLDSFLPLCSPATQSVLSSVHTYSLLRSPFKFTFFRTKFASHPPNPLHPRLKQNPQTWVLQNLWVIHYISIYLLSPPNCKPYQGGVVSVFLTTVPKCLLTGWLNEWTSVRHFLGFLLNWWWLSPVLALAGWVVEGGWVSVLWL